MAKKAFLPKVKRYMDDYARESKEPEVSQYFKNLGAQEAIALTDEEKSTVKVILRGGVFPKGTRVEAERILRKLESKIKRLEDLSGKLREKLDNMGEMP